MGLKIDVFPCLSDNYGFILVDEATGATACVDTPDADAISRRLQDLGLPYLHYILNTHWHPDHAGGNAVLKERHGATIWGPEEVRQTGPLDHVMEEDWSVLLGETQLDVIELPGHTLGHIGYYDRTGGNAFVGDTLFTLGCGRLFEGTPQQMWQSLSKIIELPDETRVYSAHEYTLGNLAFAESLGALPALDARAPRIRAMRERGEPTVPTTIGEERETNPFLVYPLREQGFEAQAAKFGALRAAKDEFKAP